MGTHSLPLAEGPLWIEVIIQRDQLLEEQRLRRQTEASARDNRAAARRPDSATLSNESIPSTPTISTPSSLTLSPATTPPLPEKTTISNYKMAPLELFRGDARCDKPHYWLRKLQGSMAYDAKDEEKLHRFAMGLAPGTHADKWWTGLDAKDKVSWADVVKAFGKKWVVPVEAEESPEELKSRIKRTILHSADLGKLVGPPGDEIHETAGRKHQRPDNAAQGRCACNTPP
ncbi:hypothetical protein B0H10DRAFT_1960647 [Mycena sp. CBHHK59/15]|nr:hypothetical protein B0H10DRAFT_1960647 [Mycena sp. CBHHK59/15]